MAARASGVAISTPNWWCWRSPDRQSQLCSVFEAEELMMPEDGAIPPRILQANVTEALEDEFVDGLGHGVSFLGG